MQAVAIGSSQPIPSVIDFHSSLLEIERIDAYQFLVDSRTALLRSATNSSAAKAWLLAEKSLASRWAYTVCYWRKWRFEFDRAIRL